MKTFEKIAKRYALTSSYYKHRQTGWPDTLAEIYDYLQQHGELPFRYEGDNWSYDAMCERQKRPGVYLSQYVRRGRWRHWPCGISTMTVVSSMPAAARGS